MKSKSKIFTSRGNLNLIHEKVSEFVNVVGKERLISISYHYHFIVVWYWDDQSHEIKEAEEKSDDYSLALGQQKTNLHQLIWFLLAMMIAIFIIVFLVIN